MGTIPTCEQAEQLLKQYNQDEFHLFHAKVVAGVLRFFAKKYDPDRTEYWTVVGLLHDLDFERYPDQHCIAQQELMHKHGLDESIIRATASHGYAITVDIEPQHIMEKILYATDELTGLIGAVTVLRPSRSVADLGVSSVKKKFKAQNFAAGCSRVIIERGAAMLGWTLDELIESTIEAMRSLIGELDV